MGIRNLCGYIYRNRLFEIKELVGIGRENERMIKIIVDGNIVSRFLIDVALEKMASNYSNKYLMLSVGEYKELENALKDFHESLKEINIELVWVVDGPKGISKDTLDRKCTIWKSDQEKRHSTYIEILSGCQKKAYDKLHNHYGPIFYINSALENLKKCGARIINLPHGVADAMIVKIYRDEGAFAILSCDTDFVIFDNCDVILTNTLKKLYRGNLYLPFVNQGSGDRIFQPPETFECPITNSKKIIIGLQLKDHEQLMMVAVMVGNEFTSEFSQEVGTLCNVEKGRDDYPNIKSMAEYIKLKNIAFESYAKSFDLRTFVRSNPTYQNAVAYSRELYLSDGSCPNECSSSMYQLSSIFNGGLQAGVITSECPSIHNWVFLDYVCEEELPKGCEGIAATLKPLRADMYSLLIKNEHDTITEVLFNCNGNCTHKMVYAYPKKKKKLKIKGIDAFLDIFSAGLFDSFTVYISKIKVISIPKLFVILILSYFYKITHGINLEVKESEFKAIFITAFFQFKIEIEDIQPILDNGTFMRLKICPSPRCITIATWIMNIYYTATNICGAALNIMHLFPPPSTIMKGSVLFAFFETMNDDSQRTSHLDNETRGAIEQIKDDIMVEYQEIYDLITKDRYI